MKKTKVIIPALAVMLLSTAASVSGTVAWFSMNNFVTASGMNIQAKAENGIIINNGVNTEWKDTATAAHTAALAVYPTTTATGVAWFHSSSNDASQANTGNPYTQLTLAYDHSVSNNVASGTGAGYVSKNSDGIYNPSAVAGVDANDDGDYLDDGDTAPIEAESAYYLLNSFYIKSSAESIEKTIYITNVQASVNGGSSVSEDLNKALRVLVKSGSVAKVFAPFEGATLVYNAVTALGSPNTTAEVNAIDSSASLGHVPAASQEFLASHVIPARSAAGTQVDIYLYFEGEDENCISDNITATLDSLNVSVKFGLESVAD